MKKTVIDEAAAALAAPVLKLLTEAEFILLPDVEAMTAQEIAVELAAIVDPRPAIAAAAAAYQVAAERADAAILEAQRSRDRAFAAMQKLQLDSMLTLERMNRLTRGKPRRARNRN